MEKIDLDLKNYLKENLFKIDLTGKELFKIPN